MDLHRQANYNNQNGTVDDYIGKADATFTVTAYSVTYNGNPHTATVSTITGVNGRPEPRRAAVDVSATTHTDAGTYNGDPWSFNGGPTTTTRAARSMTSSARPTRRCGDAYSVTFDGDPHTATVSTITGVKGETGATAGSS